MEKIDEIMKIDSINSFIFFITVMAGMPVTKHPHTDPGVQSFRARLVIFKSLLYGVGFIF